LVVRRRCEWFGFRSGRLLRRGLRRGGGGRGVRVGLRVDLGEILVGEAGRRRRRLLG
jgi:hypothetical protein